MKTLLKWFKKQLCSLELYTAIAAGTITTSILFTSPISGVANNGDYIRIMRLTGLQFIKDIRCTNISQYFRFGETAILPGQNFISSHILPVIAAEFLNRQFFSTDLFDIRYLGLVFTILFIIGIYLAAKTIKTGKKALDLLLSVMLVFVLCDIGYVSYFNSFLGEAAVDVFFILMFGFMSLFVYTKKVTLPMILCFLISSVLFISAKQANVLMGIFIALFGLSLLLLDRRLKVVISLGISMILLAGVSIYLYTVSPDSMDHIAKHQTVFYGILKDSPDPEGDLEFLGLDKKLAALKEASFFDPGLSIASDSAYMETEFYRKISFSKVLEFYLTHPSRFIKKLEVTAKNSTMIRPPYLGNYLYEDTGERLSFSSKFSLWSTLKKTYMPNNLLFVVVFFFLYILTLLFEYIRAFKSKNSNGILKANLFLLLCMIGAAQFVIPVLGDGEIDLAKHMYLYNLCFDLMFLSAVIWIITRITLLLSYLKNRISAGSIIKLIRPIVVFLIVAILCIPAFVFFHKDKLQMPSGMKALSVAAKVGEYLTFGRYDRQELLWQIIHKDNTGILIMADKIVCFKSFDAAEKESENNERQLFGSNDWDTSTLRKWLSSDKATVDYGINTPTGTNVWKGHNSYGNEPGFLYGFSESERKLIKTVPHKSILSAFDVDKKNGGNNDYLWTNVVPLLVQNYDRAYFQTVSDRVFLPDVKELKQYVYDNGLKCKRQATAIAIKNADFNNGHRYMDYWLRTPYSNSASFVRDVGSDGFVYHKDAYYGEMGVLPVLYIDSGCPIIKGDGSIGNAYKLAE